jgi:hypothetical protein
MKNCRSILATVLCASCSFSCFVHAQAPPDSQAKATTQSDPLLGGFLDPPNDARPRVWWHWMNGNISDEGIKLDLDWMHRVGLGGVTIFEGAINTPQVVPHRLIYMTPEWKDALQRQAASSPGSGRTLPELRSAGPARSRRNHCDATKVLRRLVCHRVQDS